MNWNECNRRNEVQQIYLKSLILSQVNECFIIGKCEFFSSANSTQTFIKLFKLK